MNVAFLLKSIWVFLLGVVVAIIGLYCLVFRPDMGSNSFVIMLIGLFFTGAGSIYGKRKLGLGEPMVSGPPEQRPWGYPQQPQQPQQPRQPPQEYPGYPREAYVEAREYPEQRAPGEPREVQARLETRAEPREAPSEEFLEVAEEAVEHEVKPPEVVKKPVELVPSKPVAEPTVEKPEAEITAKPLAKPKEAGIIRIVVCPNCGAENEMKDKFCYSCGFKIKPEKRKKPRKPKKVKPAAKHPARPSLKTPVLGTTPKTAIGLPPKKKPVKKVKKRPVKKPEIPETGESI